MANTVAYVLILGGRLPYTLEEVKARRMEAHEAFQRAKKYISKLTLESYEQQIVDGVRGMDCYSNCDSVTVPLPLQQ